MRIFKNLFVTIFIILALIAGMQTASAATFTVTNANDSGVGSLRDAILSAADRDTILFDSSLKGSTIILMSQLNVDKSLTIDGGSNDMIIKGSGYNRIFRVTSLTPTITLKDLTLDGGYSGSADYGSALYCSSNANLIDCTFSNNLGDCGAAVAISGNSNITNCTFINNIAQDSGGAVYCMGSGAMTITNCTFSGNNAHSGSSIYSMVSSTITNCTFINNNSYGNDVIYSYGSTLVLSNCIMWNNGGSNIYSSNTAIVNNCIIEVGYAGANNMDSDPMIGTLGDYGGKVQTVSLLPGSPAIGGGIVIGAPTTDARGVPRDGSNDIGAFQSSGFNLGSLTGTPQSATINTDFYIPLGLTVTANNHIEPVAGGKVTFSVPVSGASCALSTSASAIGSTGKVSVDATANVTVGGPYIVAASANGAESVYFTLTNVDVIKTVTISAIQGVTVPVKNQVPINFISETDQYTGTVTWTPSDNPFGADKEYTATIMLTPKSGYTFSGATENFFTVAGATIVTNDADSGIVTAVFPATEPKRFAGAVEKKNEDPFIEHELTDISGHWAEANIKYLVAIKAIDGYLDNSFKPNNNITRAEFVVCLVKAFGFEGTSGKTFDDTVGHWAKDYIDTAVANEIIKGYDELKFGPDDFITREQMAVMIVKATKSILKGGELSFTDKSDINEHANIFIYTAISNNLMKGYPDNTFNPSGKATRAEAVTVIFNALQKEYLSFIKDNIIIKNIEFYGKM